jgi:hypothetical protein
MGPPPKLTRDQVRDARRRFGAQQASCRALAQEFGVSNSGMRHAISGISWAHLTDPPPVTGQLPRPKVLNAGQVAEARRGVGTGNGTVAEFARQWSVAHESVARAVYGHSWRSLTDPPPVPQPPPSQTAGPGALLSEESVVWLRTEYVLGTSQSELAARLGVALGTVRQALHGVTWRSVTDPPPVPAAAVGGRLALSEEEEDQVVGLREDARMSWKAIGQRFGVSGPAIRGCYRRIKEQPPGVPAPR